MKRFVLVLALIIGSAVNSVGQVSYDEVHHENIPDYFKEGAFLYPILFEPMLDSFKQLDDTPVMKAILNTYCMLSHTIIGTRIPDGKIESTLSLVEEHMGSDNTIYGLAMIAKANEAGEDIEMLTEAAQIIGESAGEDSWEYAYALFCCACAAMDAEKYGDMSRSIAYADRCIEILENDHKESWLYKMALVNRGSAKFLNMDESGLNEIVDGFTLLSDFEDERNLCSYCLAGINVASIYAMMSEYDLAVAMLQDIEPFLVELDCTASNSYIALSKAMVYSCVNSKKKKLAKEYMQKAEQACIERYGEDSQQYKDLEPYRQML